MGDGALDLAAGQNEQGQQDGCYELEPSSHTPSLLVRDNLERAKSFSDRVELRSAQYVGSQLSSLLSPECGNIVHLRRQNFRNLTRFSFSVKNLRR
jgi:hypothetical protein